MRVFQTCTQAASPAKADFAAVSSRWSTTIWSNVANRSDAGHHMWNDCFASTTLKRTIVTTTGTMAPLAGRSLTGLPNTSCASASTSCRWVCSTTPAKAGPGARGPRTSNQVLQEGRSKSNEQALYLVRQKEKARCSDLIALYAPLNFTSASFDFDVTNALIWCHGFSFCLI